MRIEDERAETIKRQYYQVGKQSKTHSDHFEPSTGKYSRFAGEMGQCTRTFMIYLNVVELGGETSFSLVGDKVNASCLSCSGLE